MAFIGASNSLGGLGGSNAVARLLIVVSGDSSQLSASLAKAEGSLSGFKANASSIGNSLTRNLTLPLLALGGYAIKSASDFQTAVARIAGLTPFLEDAGISVEELSKSLLDMAADPQIIARPVDLANALYYAGSAGLETADAMEVVKLSAQGMSAGMGDASDITRVLIAALNNYKPTGLTVAHAMDVLTAAIQEGTAAPEEFAIALGRLLPIAKAAGISFDLVTASVAQLTNLGVPTRVATTSLRALFSELLAPTQAATQTLNEFGISARQLRDTLSTGGPVAAFQLLENAVEGNIEALHDIIPQIRGFTAYLGLTGDNAKKFSDIIEAVTHSTGKFQRAIDIVSKTPGFQFEKGLQQLQVAAISLGTQLLPIFLDLTHVLQALGKAFLDLPAPAKQAFAALLVAGVVVGPIIKLFGALTAAKEATVAFSGGATQMLPTVGALGKGFLTMGISAVVAVSAFQNLANGSSSLITIATSLISTFLLVKLAIAGVAAAAQAGFLGAGILGNALVALGGAATPIAIGLAAIGTAIFFAAGASKRAQEAFNQMGEAMKSTAEDGGTLNQALNAIKDEGLRDRLKELTASVKGLGSELAVTALPKAGVLVGGQLVQTLEDIVDAGQHASGTYKDNAKELARYIPVISLAARQGTGLGKAFTEAGLDMDQFLTLVNKSDDSSRVIHGMNTEATDLVGTVINLVGSYTQFSKVMGDIQTDTENTIALHALEGGNIEKLAKRYGVSTEFMARSISEYGVTATGVLEGNVVDFGKAAGFIEQDTGKMIGAAKELDEALTEIADSLSGAQAGSLNLFGDLPEAVGNFDTLIAKAQELGRVAVEQGANVRTLLERGVPSGLIEQFISEGPAMVAAFVGATTPQLNKVVYAYELAMGAIDQEILKEAAHQEGKGKSMVANFATAILSANNLTRGAGAKIVNSVGQGLAAGTVKPQALKLISSFVASLNSAKGITKKTGTEAAIAFANGIASGDFVGPKGKILVQQAAAGIAKNSDLTKAEARKLIIGFATSMDEHKSKAQKAGGRVGRTANAGIRSATSEVTASGRKFVSDFALGILNNVNLVDHATAVLAARSKSSLDEALSESPVFFTYHFGEKMVDDFVAGTNAQSARTDFNAAADNLAKKFNQAFLNKIPRFQSILEKLKELVKDNMKKAFDESDVEAIKSLEKFGKHLEDHLNKLHDRFVAFRQSIRSGFSEFLDFGSLISDAWRQYVDDMAQYTEDMAQYAEDMKKYEADLQAFRVGGSQGTEPTAPTAPSEPTAPDFAAMIQHQVDEAIRLAKALKQAQAAGLSQELLAQFAAQGSAGADALEQLLANPALISQLNAAAADIHEVIGRTVDKLGDAYFGKAIAFATRSLFKFSEGIIRLIKSLAEGLGNKKLVESLNKLLKSIEDAAANVGGGGGTQGGSGGASNNPPKLPVYTGGKTPPIIFSANRIVSGHGAKILQTVNIDIYDARDSEAVALKVRDEMLRIQRNNQTTGIR